MVDWIFIGLVGLMWAYIFVLMAWRRARDRRNTDEIGHP